MIADEPVERIGDARTHTNVERVRGGRRSYRQGGGVCRGFVDIEADDASAVRRGSGGDGRADAGSCPDDGGRLSVKPKETGLWH